MIPWSVFADTGEKFIKCGQFSPDCQFSDLITLAQDVINFLLYAIAAPIAAVMFAYAGWLYLSARGNPGQITEAHGIFGNVLTGFVVALAAWLIVSFVLSFFVGDNSNLNMLGS